MPKLAFWLERLQHNDDQYYHYRVQTNYTLHQFFIFLLLCSHYVADLIKILELCLMVVPVVLKTKFRHAQVSLPKISIPMSKTTKTTLDTMLLISL